MAEERKLTEREEKRKLATDAKTAELAESGYVREDLTVGIVYANIMAVVLCLPFVIPFTALYFICNQDLSYSIGSLWRVFEYFIIYCVAIVAHELIHGLTWSIFAKEHFRAIDFGFIKEYVTPYCTCNEPLAKGQYIIGSLMPGIVLGLLPMLLAVLTGSGWLLIFGIVMTIGAGGDMLVTLKLLRVRRQKGESIILLDHPTECGLIVFRRRA